MHSGAHNDWQAFWDNNVRHLSPAQKTPFMKNFSIMSDILSDYYRTDRWDTPAKDVLEIGAGRGTISDMFKARGCKTACTDIFIPGHYITIETARKHRYIRHDILHDQPLDETFDIIITYGLLEHFKTEDQIVILHNVNSMLRRPGIEIHYIVPGKWTNRKESNAVYRDSCKDILGLNYGLSDLTGIVHVFPYFKIMDWICPKFFSKGFIIWGGTA